MSLNMSMFLQINNLGDTRTNKGEIMIRWKYRLEDEGQKLEA